MSKKTLRDLGTCTWFKFRCILQCICFIVLYREWSYVELFIYVQLVLLIRTLVVQIIKASVSFLSILGWVFLPPLPHVDGTFLLDSCDMVCQIFCNVYLNCDVRFNQCIISLNVFSFNTWNMGFSTKQAYSTHLPIVWCYLRVMSNKFIVGEVTLALNFPSSTSLILQG